MAFPVGWNVFVACFGSFMPIVWPRFLAEGLSSWPYVIVFIWCNIFFMELTALVASVTHYAVGGAAKKD